MRAIHIFGDSNDTIFEQRKQSIDSIVTQTNVLAIRFDVDLELYFGNRNLPPEIAKQTITWWNLASMDLTRRHVQTIISPKYRELSVDGMKGITYTVIGESLLYFMAEERNQISLFFGPKDNFIRYERLAFVDSFMKQLFGNTFFVQYRIERARIDAKRYPTITLQELRHYCAALEKYLPNEANQILRAYLEGKSMPE